jgi:hypothetical protein
MAAQINFDWKKDMDALVAHTTKNWWATGNKKKAAGLNIQYHLPKTPAKKKK